MSGIGRLVSLNAIRSPELWARWSTPISAEEWQGTNRAVWARLEREFGVPLDLPVNLEGEDLGLSMDLPFMLEFRNRPILEVLDFAARKMETEVVLEKDRIRILPSDEGLKFWTAWWEKESRK